MGTAKDSEKTRAKLIEAAGRLFAEQGFNGVTVRDIAKAADTHLSALNYHFKAKDALYREVLMVACRSDALSVEDKALLLKLSPRDSLFLCVKESLAEYRKQTAANWRSVLITRECREPSHEFAEVREQYLEPETGFLAELIGKAVGKPPADLQVRFAVISLIALVETFGLYNHLVDAVAPGLNERFEKKDALAKQIVHLVLEAADSSANV